MDTKPKSIATSYNENELKARAESLGVTPDLIPIIDRLDRILAILEPLLAEYKAGEQGARAEFERLQAELGNAYTK